METIDLLRNIESKTIQALAADREIVTSPGFVVAIHPTNDMVWLNFAVPLAGQCGTFTPEVAERLRGIFRSRGRTLRFEFFETLWPTLARQMEACGLQLQVSTPLMLCSPADLRMVHATGVAIQSLGAGADDALIEQFLAAAKRGFGMEPVVERHEVDEQRQALARETYRCAYCRVDGQVVGVGTMNMGNDELVGVATVPEHRRRGIGAAISSHLVKRHFDSGRGYVWLAAGDEAARATYDKIGFRSAGTQLNYIDAPRE
jgi:ribosomal protein S18 acetylase RimI-like enzyme